jgi:predicted phosphohydrolase
MGRLFALADLHLSLTGDKPMDVFGEAWVDHPRRMAEAWDARVGPGDTVLLPGDLSWARNMREAEPDLAWIGARPGRKILLRGNHDTWWTGLARVRAALPDGCDALQNDALRLDTCVVLGARGWLDPEDPLAGPDDARIFRRELERLRLSILAADRLEADGLPRVAMLHYPPWIEGREPTRVVALLERARVAHCVYGHLHGGDHRLAVTGQRNGVEYHLVAADAVDFGPVEIPLAGAS